jgi:hypothetical protein
MKDEQDPRNTRYYHGGDAGLLVGQFILPSLVTGKDNMVGLNPLWKKDRVYVIKDIAGAMFFASASKRPTVYEVTPEGDLENDPDDKIKGRSFACPKAKIIAIHSVPPEVVRRNVLQLVALQCLDSRDQRLQNWKHAVARHRHRPAGLQVRARLSWTYEASLYRKASETHRALLCPVIWVA